MELFSAVIYIILLIFIIDYWWKPKHGNVLPYRVPIIGHLLLFYKKDIHHALSDLATKYGDVYTLQICNQNVVILNGYDAIFEGLVPKGKDLGGRIKSFRLTHVLRGKDIAFQDISTDWKKTRNLVHGHLKQYGEGLTHIQNIVLDISQDLVDTIKTKCVDNRPFDPSEDIYLTICNTMSSLITGKKYDMGDVDFQKWVRMSRIGDTYIVSMNQGWELDIFPWLRYFGNRTFKEMNNFVRISEELFSKLMAESDTGDSSMQRGMAHALIRDLKKGDKEDFLDEESVRLAIVTIMAAGILTSSSSLCAFIHIMAAYPNVQENIFKEVSKVLKKNGHERITLDDRDEMPYTRACIIELMRYVSVAPLAAHLTMCKTNIQGCDIDSGKIVVHNFWYLHHSEKYWDKPWEFQPERFLDENNELLPSDHIKRKRVLAFGSGVRICIGEKLAMARLFIFMTTLIKEFQIKNVNERNANLHDPRNYDYNAILTPKRGVVNFINRTASE